MKSMLIALTLGLALSAQANHFTRTVKKAEKKFNIDVQIDSATSDECIAVQLDSFIKDLRKADKEFKKVAKAKLENKSLIFGKTENKGDIKGQMVFLDLYTFVPMGNNGTGPMMQSMLIDRKLVADKRENLNIIAMNEVMAGGDQIQMNLFKVENKYSIKYYSTYSKQAFNKIKDEASLKEYQADGYIMPRPMVLEGGVDFDQFSCGNLTLKEFLTKF